MIKTFLSSLLFIIAFNVSAQIDIRTGTGTISLLANDSIYHTNIYEWSSDSLKSINISSDTLYFTYSHPVVESKLTPCIMHVCYIDNMTGNYIKGYHAYADPYFPDAFNLLYYDENKKPLNKNIIVLVSKTYDWKKE